jgi:hypothetical protein
MSVDKYRRGSYQGYWYQDASYARPARPRATVTVMRAAYNIAKGIRGPSATGPYTVFAYVVWGNDQYDSGMGRGAGTNFGLA